MPQSTEEQRSAAAAAASPAPAPTNTAKPGSPDTAGDASAAGTEDRTNKLGPSLLTHMATDQRTIWTSPAKLRPSDAAWLVPVAGVAAALFATDREFSRSLSNSPSRLTNSQNLSNYGLVSLVSAGGGLYLWGKLKSDNHKTETAILAGEAAVNSLLVTEALKYSTGRDRPQEGGGGGRFFQGGSSFPSEHASAAWSIAGVIAHEYPGPLTSFLAYGMAATVSVARVTAKQHFPSDVFVGAVLGWWISRQTYRAHHDFSLGGKSWQTYPENHDEDVRRRPRNLGSPYVPLESWVYPAFERLSAMGYIPVANFAIKPWSRIECATLLLNAEDKLGATIQRDTRPQQEALRLETALREEFARELAALESGSNQSLLLDSVYARVTSISGPPLTDGFHFGQTISYDYGRPYQRGTNAIAGAEVSGTMGPFAFFVQPEYQHAPSAPPLSLEQRTVIADVDHTPLQPAVPFGQIDRLGFLQGYVSYTYRGWQISAGKQSLSWGPSTEGSLLFSNNAEPFPMIRLTQQSAPELPGILKYIWPARTETIFGRLEGHTIFPRPYIFGQKFTLEWGPYFEFSYARTTIIGGQGGDPLNMTTFGELLFGRNCTVASCATKGAPPGESNTASDMTFRVPHTHGTLLFYVDLYSEDDSFAWRALSESIYRPGVYLARLPGLPKMDLRVEVANSETPFFQDKGFNGVNYNDFRYQNGFTNAGNLLGNTVGREGQTVQATSTYWFAPRTSLQVSYKNNSVNPKFIPQGGRWQDYNISYQTLNRSGLYVQGAFQFERISRYPILFYGPANNVTASLELGYRPKGGLSLFHRADRASSSGQAGPSSR
jgi:hypothetical protein